MATTIQTDVPLVNVPFVDKAGNVTEAWFLFLIQLWRRTGGGGGVPPKMLTVTDVLALEEAFAQPVIDSDALVGEAIFGSTGPKDAQAEMIFAPVVSDIANQTFSSGTGFTPGTTTQLTLSSSFADAGHLWVFFDAAFQGDDQYSLSGTTLTFISPIPVGVSKVYIKGLR